MRLIGRCILHIVSNAIALYVCTLFVSGFTFSGSLTDIGIAALVLTALNIIVRPVLKLFFGPFIVLTFGLLTILINALMLYILDIWSDPLSIEGYIPLLIATVVIGVVNLLIHFGARSSKPL